MKALVLLLIFGLIASTAAHQPFHLLLIPYRIYQYTLTLLEDTNSDKLVAFEYKQLKAKNVSTEKLKEHCVKNKGEDTWRKFEENFLNFTMCLSDPFNAWQFCGNYQPNLHTCLKTYSKRLSVCEEDDGKDLFSLHINSTTKMADYICVAHPYLQYPNALQNMNAKCLLEFANYMIRRDVEDKLEVVRRCIKEKQAASAEADQIKSYCNSQLFLNECVLKKVNVHCDASGPVKNIVEDIFFNATFSFCRDKYSYTLS
ncbi:uncharacterized protein LOC108744357 [Agrilus planipennis]|uniref:Uncharacterized protein LOC108744357 n=1 Tax=Agrilus planipennis TaxID=224129 RepID=A0A1W4XS04_AGRPL|nr:uncharacterized protein LOC108744357 [Agrilus planipennis]